jgi:hypothetical protein
VEIADADRLGEFRRTTKGRKDIVEGLHA